MAFLTLPVTPDGLVLPVLLGLDSGRMSSLGASGQPVPPPLLVRGLIDTGSNITMVTPGLASRAGLTFLKKRTTQTAVGPATVDLYEASLGIPGPVAGSGFARSYLVVMETLAPLQGVEVAVGMDVLSEWLLILDGPNRQFTLAY